MLTTTERELGCWVVNGDDLEPYDILLFLGGQHRIDRLAPAGPNTLLEQIYPEQDVRVIWSGGREYTWAVPSQTYRILPRPEASRTER
jgi:hypothetical protein